ncbi:MAG: hypothetical protein ABW321_11855 [Polyangiales bacterium]
MITRHLAIIAKRHRNENGQVKYFKTVGIAGQGGLIREQDFKVWIDWIDWLGELKAGQVDARRVVYQRV